MSVTTWQNLPVDEDSVTEQQMLMSVNTTLRLQ